MDTTIKSRKRGLWPWLAGLVVIAIALSLLANFAGKDKRFRVNGERLSISTVRTALFEDYLALRVYVEPYKTVYLDAIEGGRVDNIFVEEGDIVEQGQALLELSNTTLQLDIISREAQVSEQLNDLRNTKLAIEQNRLNLKRELIELDYQIKSLKRRLIRRKKVSNYIGKEELESLTDELDYMEKRRALTLESQEAETKMRFAQVAQLEENVIQQEKNLLIARSNLDNLSVKAPRSGRLSDFNAEIGETKDRGERLGQIDDIHRYKLSGQVSEFYLSKLAVGQRAQIDIDGRIYTLELSKIYPEIKNNEFEIDLIFIDDHPQNIRRGQTLNPRLSLSQSENSLLVDNGSFFQESGGAWVFVVDENGRHAYRRDIQFGRRTPNHLEIISGLQEGEKIIVSSYRNYRNIDKLLIED